MLVDKAESIGYLKGAHIVTYKIYKCTQDLHYLMSKMLNKYYLHKYFNCKREGVGFGKFTNV